MALATTSACMLRPGAVFIILVLGQGLLPFQRTTHLSFAYCDLFPYIHWSERDQIHTCRIVVAIPHMKGFQAMHQETRALPYSGLPASESYAETVG